MMGIVEPIDGKMTFTEDLKKALQTSENNFKQLFNSIHIPQWIYDANSMLLLFFNDAAINQYGYLPEELVKMTMLEISPQEETQKLVLYNEFMKNMSQPFSIVNPHRKKNGERILVETTYVNINYEERQCVLVSSRDITDKIEFDKRISSLKLVHQKKITLATINGQEKELDQIGKELHDNIGQLLTAATLHLEFARTDGQFRIDFIERGEKILRKAIDEIRSLSNSLAPPTLKDLSFEISLFELFETYLANKSFKIELSFDKKLELLDTEIKISLFRIVQEQLNNILKHAQAKIILISLSIADAIYLSIEDDGKGFDTTIKRNGLGITNMTNRIGLHNGTVKLISKPQEGCSLLVCIPLGRTTEIIDHANIIIVEDDPDDQEIITRVFAEVAPQYNITCLNDGKMLVDSLRLFSDEELPSLIVLDYNMPLLNGLETLKLLETDQRYNKIPKIIYSSSTVNYIKNLRYSANATAYITKGATMDEIKENVQEMLSLIKKVETNL